MRILKPILLTLVGLIVLLAVVGLFLPERSHVERTVIINAPADRIFPLVSDFSQWSKWSPWYAKDPNAQYRYEGPPTGVGSKMYWSSEKPDVGSGSQEIIESKPDTFVKTHLDFGAQGKAEARFTIAAEGNASRVTWGLDSEFGYDLIGRYFGLMFDQMIGPDYEKGLANLKALAESSG